MVYGIGCDLCSIARMEKSLLGPHGAVFARRAIREGRSSQPEFISLNSPQNKMQG